MHGLMVIFVIIGITLVTTVPQGYQYNNFKSTATGVPISLTSTNTDYKSLTTLSGNSQINQNKQQPIQYFNKQFFIHTAPDETYDETQKIQKISNSLKKNLRVLFIKAPSNNGLTNAAEKLAKEQTSEHTIIYVLNKYTDSDQLQHELDQLNEINPNKPEVHFVRYKTNDDVENAKNSIQSQYESLGGDGSIEVINEGIPDIISYVGSVANTNNHQQQNQQIEFNNDQSFQSTGISLGNTYLPSLH